MDVNPEDFDFSKVAVTEDEYYALLDTFSAHPAVTQLTHSLPMNEIRLTVDAAAEDVTDLCTEWPRDITIRSVGYTDDGDIELALRTTKYFTPADTDRELFTAEYSDAAIVYCQAQLSLFDDVETTGLARDDHGRLHVRVELTDDFETSHIFNEIQDYLGVTISALTVERQRVSSLLFRFDETVTFTDKTLTACKNAKERAWTRTAFDASDPVTAPCGHPATPELLGIRNVRTGQLESFDTVDVTGIECYEIPVERPPEKAFYTITDWADAAPEPPDTDAIPVTSSRGYHCPDCDRAYLPVDESQLYDQFAEQVSLPERTVEVTVPDTDETHTFPLVDRPFLPVEYL